VREIAEALPAEWFEDFPVTGKEMFAVSLTMVP
jgi:hypothetical protein